MYFIMLWAQKLKRIWFCYMERIEILIHSWNCYPHKLGSVKKVKIYLKTFHLDRVIKWNPLAPVLESDSSTINLIKNCISQWCFPAFTLYYEHLWQVSCLVLIIVKRPSLSRHAWEPHLMQLWGPILRFHPISVIIPLEAQSSGRCTG